MALGLALTSSKTRIVGIAGVAAYTLWLGSRALAARNG
jgi:hypothetical protein